MSLSPTPRKTGSPGPIQQRGLGHGSAAYLSRLTLLLLLLATSLTVSVTLLFHQRNNVMDMVTALQVASWAGDSGDRWEHVRKLTEGSKDRTDFLLKVQALGIMGGHRGHAAASQVASEGHFSLRLFSSALGFPKGHAMQHQAASAAASTMWQPAHDPLKWRPGDDEYMDPDIRPVRGGPPPLSAKLAHSVAQNNTVIVTAANHAVLDFVLNWAERIRQQGLNNMLVGAADPEIGRALVLAGIPAFAMYNVSDLRSSMGGKELIWGKAEFSKLNQLKLAMVCEFLTPAYGLDLLLLDVDSIFLGNALEYFALYPEADVLASSDLVHPTLEPWDEGLELPDQALAGGTFINIGIMLLRNRPSTIALVNKWYQTILNDTKIWKQGALNNVIKLGLNLAKPTWHPTNPRLIMALNDTLALGILPVARFLGGHTGFIQRLHEIQHVKPLMIHATYQYGASLGKRNRMREAMLWNDGPSWWTNDTFIAINVPKTPDLPPSVFQRDFNYSQKKAYNKAGLHMQVEAVFAGMGLAGLFNRSLIMPRLACYCDKHWEALVDCRLRGAGKLPLPFVCPMDYVLDPLLWTDTWNNSFIPRWREYSFLDNPRCPPELKVSRLTVRVSQKLQPDAQPEERWTAQDGTIVLVPPGLTDLQLFNALKAYKHLKIWWFEDPAAAFSKGFSDARTQAQYKDRIKRMEPQTQPEDM